MTESEFEYLRRRKNEELDLADHSEVAVAADAHRRLAGLYAKRAAAMRGTPWIEMAEPMAMPQLSREPR